MTPHDLRRMLSNYGWQPSRIWISGAELWRHQYYEFSDVHIPVGETALDRECFQSMMNTAVSQISIHTKIPVVDLLEQYGQPSPNQERSQETIRMNDLEMIQTDPIKLRSKTNMRQPYHKQGAKLQQRPIHDPVAIVNEAMRERSIALGKFVRSLVPSWEVLAAGVILALAFVIIWVCWK